MNNSPPPPHIVTFLADLTGREEDVLRVSRPGWTMKRIADWLGVSPDTVMAHRKHLLKKWRTHRPEATGGKAGFRTMRQQVAQYLLPGLPKKYRKLTVKSP
jgi:DNA-binding NarL/FixJ family response regulator